MKKLMFSVLMTCGTFALCAADYVVTEPTTISTVDSTAYSNLVLHADLTVKGDGTGNGNKTYLTANGVAHAIGSEHGEFATLTITNGAKIAGIGGQDTPYINVLFGGNGGKGGQIAVYSPFAKADVSADLWGNRKWNYVLSANATSDSGTLDIFRLGRNGALGINNLKNENPNIVSRVLFEGGMLYWPNVWENSGFFTPVSGAKIQLVSVNGEDIRLGSSTGRNMGYVNSGAGTVETTGSGNVVFWGATNDKTFNARGTMRVYNGVVWNHTGDLIVEQYGCIMPVVDWALPYGPGHGIFRFRNCNSSNKAYLDMNGKIVALNGVEAEYTADGIVTNTSSTTATLILGTNDVSGVLSAGVGGKINTIKTGSGELNVCNKTLPNLWAEEGSVIVANELTIGKCAIVGKSSSSPVTLVVSNVTLTCGSLALTNAVVKFYGGGEVNCSNISFGPNTSSKNIALSNRQILHNLSSSLPEGTDFEVDVGASGVANLSSSEALARYGLDVKSGTVRVGGVPIADEYWRFTFTKAQKEVHTNAYDNTTPMTFALGRLHLFGVDGTAVNLGFGDAGLNKEISSLAAGKITSNHGCLIAEKGNPLAGGAIWSGVAHLGAGFAEWYYGTVWTNHVVTVDEPITVTLRLKSGNAPYGYLFNSCVNLNTYSVAPKDWKVESSADGVTWSARDGRADWKRTTGDPKTWENDGMPILFTNSSDAANWSFKPGCRVRVANGATINLDAVPTANIAISNLEVDLTAGAGTITKFVPAESGTVYLTNVPQEALKHSKIALPLTLGSVSGTEALADWKVYADGERINYANVVYDSSKKSLVIRNNLGTVILLR